LVFVKVLARREDRDALRIDGIYALALFILVSLISARISNQPYSYKIFIQNCSYVLIYSIIVVGCRSLEDIKLLLNILLYCGVFLILFFGTFNVIPLEKLLPNTLMADAVMEGVEHVATYKLDYTQRSSMLWFESNSYGYLLSVLIMLALRRILCEKCRVTGKIFNYSILLILLYNLVLTQSRGAFLAATIAVGFILTKSLRGKQLPILALVGALVLLVSVVNSDTIADLKNRFRTIPEMASYGRDITLYEGTDSGRIVTIELALEEFTENPIWGNGGLHAGWYAGSGVHCFYIDLLAKWGILGFTFYTAFLIGTYMHIRKATLLLKNTNDTNINFAYIFMGIFIACLVEALFAPLRYIFWISMGTAAAFCKLVIQNKYSIAAVKVTNRPNNRV
jgi:O-antigen ligase